MVDNENTNSANGAAPVDALAKTPAVKKQRAPRRAKVVAEPSATPALSKTEKLPRGRRKRSDTVDVKAVAADASATSSKTSKVPAKIDGRKRAARQASQAAAAPNSAIAEMADLLKLEEENKQLRKTLAEKLRAENTDLRNRLGLK